MVIVFTMYSCTYVVLLQVGRGSRVVNLCLRRVEKSLFCVKVHSSNLIFLTLFSLKVSYKYAGTSYNNLSTHPFLEQVSVIQHC